jgi:poly(3-hydroxybutyrate) depolymerase
MCIWFYSLFLIMLTHLTVVLCFKGIFMKWSLFCCDFLIITSLLILITCGPEPIRMSNDPVAPCAFVTNQQLTSITANDTSQYSVCDTAHTEDALTFLGIVRPTEDSRVTRVQWDFGDENIEFIESSKHAYHKGGTYQAKFFIFDGSGNSLYDSVLVYVNTTPDSVHLAAPSFDTSFTSSPVTLTWKGYDKDLFDSSLSYLVIVNDGTKCDTILKWKKDTSVIFNQSVKQESKVTWSVTAMDQFGDSISSRTSVFYIKPVIKDTSDLLLAKLKMSSGTLCPVFADTVFSYTDTVPAGTSSVIVTASARVSTSAISINDIQLRNFDSAKVILLQSGKPNTVTVKVTSKNNETKPYTITVIPASLKDTIYLCSLAASAGKLIQSTAPLKDSLRDTVPYTNSSITVHAVANDSDATICIGSSDTIKSGGISKSIPLNAGSTTIIPVKVVHHKGIIFKMYTLSVYRQAIPDTQLASLQISAGSIQSAPFPVPDSIRNTVSFFDSVIIITPASLDSTSTIKVDTFKVKSLYPSPKIHVDTGSTEIKIQVITSNGSHSKTYHLFIFRKSDSSVPLTVPPSNIVAIGISVSKIRITWDDNINATYYTVQKSKLADSNFTNVGKPNSNIFIDTTLDSGSIWFYRVSASNAKGTTDFSSVVSATTFRKPVITVQPVSKKVTEGNSVVLSIGAAGIPAPSYHWQKNKVAINVTTSTCTTAVLSLSDNGTAYRCIVSNAAGEVTSNEALLTVDSLFTKPAILSQPSDTSIYVGDTLVLAISDSGSYLKQQWRRDGIALLQAVSCTLSIKNAKATDAGTYTVKVWNKMDSVTTLPFHIRVFPKGTAGLSSLALSATKITVSWNIIEGALWYRVLRSSDKNSFAPICSTTQISITDSLLTEGTRYSYKLNACNSSGEKAIVDSTAVTTWYGPQISTQPQAQRILSGQTISLSVTASGLPACSYQWKKDGAIISGAILSEYKLTNCMPGDSGDYTVQVTNAVRAVNSNTVHVSVIPIFTLSTPTVPSSGGTVVRSENASVYEKGDTLKLTAHASSGYRFNGWSGDTTAADTVIKLTMLRNRSINANFMRQYSLTLSGTPNGIVTPSGTMIVDSGAATAVSATVNAGGRFYGWKTLSGNATITNISAASTSLMLRQSNASVQAVFSSPDTGWSAGCGKTLSTMHLDTGTYQITSDGLSRRYLVYIPQKYDPQKSYKLVFCWHPVGGNIKSMVETEFYRLKHEDSSQTTIFVAPEGINATWAQNEKDHTFFMDMLKIIKNEVCIDTARIFSVGFSMGAMFTYSLAQNHQKQLRAVACMSASNSNIYLPVNTGEPLAYMGVHGLSDGTLPVNQGRQCRNQFILNNGGDISEIVLETTVGSLTHAVHNYSSVNQKFPVKWCTFDGGHFWTPADGQNNNSDLNITWVPAEVWNFFSQF